MSKTGEKTEELTINLKIEKNALFIVAYIIPIITGIVVLLISSGDKRLKKHALQAIFLGIAMLLVSAIFVFLPHVATIINLLLWIYGIYVGMEAYNGKDIEIPFISQFVNRHF